jgi:hypothetical protein
MKAHAEFTGGAIKAGTTTFEYVNPKFEFVNTHLANKQLFIGFVLIG